MRALRWVAVLLLVVATPFAISGFWAERALSDPGSYSDRAAQAWQVSVVRAEVADEIGDQVEAEIRRRAGASQGESNILLDTAISLARDRIEAGVGSPEFAEAWRQWQGDLYADLGEIARGGQPPVTRVSGSELTVDIQPLVAALLSGGLPGFAGDFASDIVGDEPIETTIDTESDLAGELASLGLLAASRWWALAGVVALLAAAAATTRPPRRGLAAGLIAAAAGCTVASLLVVLTPGGTSDGSTPHLADAMTKALTAGWAGWLMLGAVLTAPVGAALLLLPRRRAPRSGSA